MRDGDVWGWICRNIKSGEDSKNSLIDPDYSSYQFSDRREQSQLQDQRILKGNSRLLRPTMSAAKLEGNTRAIESFRSEVLVALVGPVRTHELSNLLGSNQFDFPLVY
jgi:hypothetical protein